MSRQPRRQDAKKDIAFTSQLTTTMATFAASKRFPAHTLQVALAASVQDGAFADTAFHLYSRRLEKRKIGGTRVVYANSIVMKHLGANISRRTWLNFKGLHVYCDSPLGPTVFNAEHEKDQDTHIESKDYGYESDSDLDECEVVTLADSDFGEDGAEDSLVGELFLDALDVEARESEVPAEPEEPAAEEPKEAGPQCKYRIILPNIAANT